MFRLRTLGVVDLTHPDGRRVRSVLAQPKRLALLVYLAQARPRGPQRRDQLLAPFWPDFDEARARNNLSQSVHQLRRALGEGVLEGAGAELYLDRDRFDCDACAFEQAVEAGELERALELYAGPFLESFHVPGASGFERWSEEERARLQEMASRAANELAARRLAGGQSEDAAVYARRALEMSPYDETALRHLVRALDDTGNRAAAVETLEGFASRLAADLDLAPAPETLALLDALRSREARLADGRFHDPGPARVMESDPHPDSHAAPDPEPHPDLADAAASPSDRPSIYRRRMGWLASGAAAAFAAVALAGWLLTAGSEAAVVDGRILVAPFQNETGDTSLAPLGDITADWLTASLARTGLVDVVDSRWLFQVLRPGTASSGEAPAERLSALANETGAARVVWGRYYVVSDSLFVSAAILEPDGRTVVRALAPVGAPAATPTKAVDAVRERLLGALAALSDPRLAAWNTRTTTPPSYGAYVEYVTGLEPFSRMRYDQAVEHFRRAWALDSAFVAVLPHLYESLLMTVGKEEADSVLEHIEKRRHLLPPFDLAMVDFHSGWSRGDREAMLVAARRMTELAPGSPDARFLHGMAATTTNRFREAVEAFRHLEQHPDPAKSGFGLANFPGMAHHLLGDYRSEQAYIARLRRRMPDDVDVCSAWLVALAPDAPDRRLLDEMAECIATAGDEFGWQTNARILVARELYAHGRSELARALADTAAAALRERLRAEPEATDLAVGLTYALMHSGGFAEAQAICERLLAEGRGPTPMLTTRWGIVAARAGDVAAAEEALRRLTEDVAPQVSPARNALQRARVLANLNRPDEAIALLREAIAGGRSAAEVFHRDVTLRPLHGHPEYEALVRPRQ